MYSQDGKFFGSTGIELTIEGDPVTEVKGTQETVDPPEFKAPLNVELEAVIDPPATVEDAVESLIAQGLTHTAIGKELGLTRQKVTRIASNLSK